MEADSYRRAFDEFIESLVAKGIEECSSESSQGEELLRNYLQVSIGEARFSLELILEHLGKNKRILEVGSGLGITSGFLSSQGFKITSLDPGGQGFNQWTNFAKKLRDVFALTDSHLSLSAEQLDPLVHGYFDLIFSNNVLEHVSDVEKTLTNLHNSLAPGGIMIHNCPNYTFPYEPHFGIPLVPCRPNLTSYFLPEKISHTDLWKSINFITARQVRQLADQLKANLTFTPGTILKSLQRLEPDKHFRSRHPYLTAISKYCRQGLMKTIISAIPATLSTPMIFTWRRD